MGIPLHSRPVCQAPGWCAPFIGLPYDRGARGPELFDCWGLIMLVGHRQFGLPVPAYEGVVWHNGRDKAGRDGTAAVVKRESAALWEPVEDEQPGDAVVLRMFGEPLHVGIVAAPGWMLHASEGADSALERYDGMAWHARVLGFHRFRREP